MQYRSGVENQDLVHSLCIKLWTHIQYGRAALLSMLARLTIYVGHEVRIFTQGAPSQPMPLIAQSDLF
jgi:hypothetical protein